MTTNNNSKYKQENELLKISPLIRSLGYTPNFNMCGDKPDICLPSFENKEIGIEVTEYAERYHVKVESNECTPEPTLLCSKLFGRDFEDAHDAASDIEATQQCFWELRKKGLI